MKRCLIVDDDPLSRLTLERLIAKTDTLKLVKSCASSLEAIDAMRQTQIDLLFLDVEMPEMTGLELLKSLTNPPAVILVSAREKYAVEAFELEVVDYLVKPVSLQRFIKAVDRVFSHLELRHEAKESPAEHHMVFVKVENQLRRLPTEDILWIEATGDYVTIHTERGTLVSHVTMKGILEKLPSEMFVRVHRSHIVQLRKIKAIEGNLIIIGKNLIPIAESNRATLMKRLNTL